MKTKLLRKFRKNYSVSYYPSGFVDPSGEMHHTPVLLKQALGWFGRVGVFDVTAVGKFDSPMTEIIAEEASRTVFKWFREDHKNLYKKKNEKRKIEFRNGSKSNQQVRAQAA